MLDFDVVTDVECRLGESPVWDESRQALFWCDIPNGHVWRYTPATAEVQSLVFDGPVGCVGLCNSGKLLVACGLKILLVDADTGQSIELHNLERLGYPSRFNDGRVGPDGAFWVGTLHQVELEAMKPVAALWRFTANSAEIVIDGLKCANGLAFSADGKVMQHSDSVAQWVKRYLLNPLSGQLSCQGAVCTPDQQMGRPDGATFDIDEIYWSAGVSAGVLNAFDAGGELVQRMELPVPHPTMPCFGGNDFRTLFVTSHRIGMSDEGLQRAPLSGRLLTTRMPRPGFASPRFDDRDL